MDNALVSEANNLATSPHPPSTYSIDLGAFDLDEALASSAGDSCRRFAHSKSFVATLPAVQHMDGDAVCSVCMQGFDQRSNLDSDDGNKQIQIPCGHVYHSGCIAAWISRSNSCPLCRSHIFPPLSSITYTMS
ncbi:E3 ubiquitin-protein ligase RNF181-like [Neltuma alba]|uniref:E3 ubiquitin-protein ligase RNF181-like n=1 Tax=Neltuma alba TaxID=207710 RepID=UPI0010A2BB65|nr:E3 ubiquitin-protein ligase RNF181-like [Prosopis alba]XP_028806532.1 E3 ubiquitin-protein ligase RNF181-like [Prosopis alba]